MPTFAQTMQRHLAAYKIHRLGVKELGSYVHQGKELHYAHILPRELRWLNILEPIRAEVRDYVEKHLEAKLHKYFHHLNSSQAFAFNLFFPFFEQGNAAALLKTMGLPEDFVGWQPEHVADASEGTNVDVMWTGSKGTRTYCEVKLTEAEFGVAKRDRRHVEKLKTIYAPVLAGQCDPELLVPEAFFAHYQLLRNVWLAARDPKAAVVFLVPRSNAVLWAQLGPFICRLGPELTARVHAIAIEDVLDALVSIGESTRLGWYARLLQEKYDCP